MKGIVFALLAAAAPLWAAGATSSVTDRMAQGKLSADLGDNAAATRAFAAVADDTSAPAAVRIEALIRLGSARRSAGDHEGALRAFERASKDPALDRETKALLVQALGGALPGSARWDAVWRNVTFVVDRANAARPGLAIRWPDADQAKSDVKGEIVDVEFKDGDIVDVLRLFGDIGKVNMLIDPAVQGSVTVKLSAMPWEAALDAIVSQRGLTWHRDGRVLSVSRSGRLDTNKRYTGEPITLDFKNGDIQDVMRLFSNISKLSVVVGPGVGGTVSLKLNEVPWDQVFDLVLRMHGLSSRREGNVIWVSTGWMPPMRTYSGKAIDVDVTNKDALATVDGIAKTADVELTVDPRVQTLLADPHWGGPKSLSLRLRQVPADQALDLAARLSQLALDREGHRFTLKPLVPLMAERQGPPGFPSWRVSEVVVRGVMNRKASGPVGFVQAPDGMTYFPQVGAKMLNGAITAIDATGVTFEEQIDGGGTRKVKKPIQGADEVDPRLDDLGRRGAAPAALTSAPSHQTAVATPDTPAKPGDAVRVTDPGVVPPMLIRKVTIVKPKRAVAANVTGTVLVAVLVDENGKPAEVKLLQRIAHPDGQECNAVALDAVKQMEWQPATKDGVRVKTWITAKIPFLPSPADAVDKTPR